MTGAIIFFLVLSVFGRAVSLECYQCSGSTHLEGCMSTVTCRKEQVCYKNRTYSGKVVYNLGCIDQQACGNYANRTNAVEVMAVSSGLTRKCHECCSTEKCNRKLCAYKHPSVCVDDEAYDCALLNSVFDICTTINRAKKYCPKYCKLCDVVDGNWSPWSPWSQCDVTCDNGTLTRTRSCSDPSPQNGGLDCHGYAEELKPCFRELCPVHGDWTEWMEWVSCSVTCGFGLQRRSRNCTSPFPIRFGDHCFGDSLEYRQCFPGPCANGGWSEWQTWSTCSGVICGTGIQQRSRTCSNPKPSALGSYCIGNSIELIICETPCFSDCYDIKRTQDNPKSGIYHVHLWQSKRKIQVYCDMDTDQGGWTVFQKRFDGSIDFLRNFSKYVKGFGDLNKEFWLGLDFIQELASQGESDLRIDLEAANGSKGFETLTKFNLSLGPDYTLEVGTTKDSSSIRTGKYSFGPYHKGSKFSTYDHDVDSYPSNCAAMFHGAWWYNECYYASLNGRYLTPGTPSNIAMIYVSYQGYTALKSSKMMMRRT